MKQTPLHDVHLSLGAKMFRTAAGYHMPAYYASVEEEHRAVRERVGMIDLSLMGRIDIVGPQSFDLVQRLAVNDAAKLGDGQIMYTTFCNERGNIVDDVTVWRFGEEHFRIVTSSVMRQRNLKWVRQVAAGFEAYVTDVSSSLGMVAVQGPKSKVALQKVCDVDLDGLRFFHFVQGSVAGLAATVARVGFTGELGYEVYVGSEDTVDAWEAISGAGKEFGVVPYGLDVLDSLRYEKGFIFFGFEVTEKNNPFECGLDRWIRFEKQDFLGKDALAQIQKAGPQQKLVGLELEDRTTVFPASAVESDGRRVGETLLWFRGITLLKDFAWAFVDWKGVDVGDEVEVAADGRKIAARIVDIRGYDPNGDKMRG